MRVLVAPLNWGLGHATRCIPLIHQYLADGHEVVLVGDGESLLLLQSHFPTLPVLHLAPLNLHYSSSPSQIGILLLQLPKVLWWLLRDRMRLRTILRHDHYDLIISDNRFALYPLNSQLSTLNSQPHTIYLTHQLHILLPPRWKHWEPLATRIHAHFYNRYDEVWVPDYPDYATSLAGDLSHPQIVHRTSVNRTSIVHRTSVNRKYLGSLSRFSLPLQVEKMPAGQEKGNYDVVVLLSGLEPQRSLMEQEWRQRLQGQHVLFAKDIYDDKRLASYLQGAKRIIARSGYSTIMDLHVLGVLDKAELYPTPGQPEQEYLAQWLTMQQKTRCSPVAPT